MKICLIHPASNFNYETETMKLRNRYSSGSYNYVHLGLAYIAAYLKANGHHADIWECEKFALTFDKIKDIVAVNQYDVVGISTMYQNLKNVIRIATIVKQLNPNIFVYLGGYGATFNCEQILKNSGICNCCVLGEGEITTLELVNKLEAKDDWRTVKGLAYSESGKVVITEKRELVQDLDIFPFPTRVYNHEANVAQIVASRGCYGKCNYCGIQEFFAWNSGKCLRRRSPENVFAEIDQLVKENNINYFVFCDPNFVLNGLNGKKWVEKFCELIKEANLNIKFDVDIRSNEIVCNEELLQKLKEVGLETVLIGIENFSQKELDFMVKLVDAETNVQAIKTIQKLGIKYVLGILLFNPITELDDIILNLKTIESLDFRINNTITKPISCYGPIIASPGLSIYKFIKENGYYKSNEKGYEFLNSDVDLCYKIIQRWNQIMPPEILKFRTLDIAAEEFNLVDVKEKLKSIYSRMYEQDLQIYLELTEKIKNKSISTIEEGYRYLEDRKDWVFVLRDELIDCYNTIQKYW